MHLLIPFAACQDPASRQVLRGLQLPHLEQLLARLSPQPLERTPEKAPAMPHEYALARALGLGTADPIAWAAWQASCLGLDSQQAWAFITPCHWQVGQSQVTLDHPDTLALQEDESRALLAAMQTYFVQDGITLVFDSASRWLAHGEVFRDLGSASLDRVAGHDLAPWMPANPILRRLQNEMQMLLYTHPLNDARSQRGAMPVNSFWISGCGSLATAPVASGQPPIVPRQLAHAALCGDWQAWGRAWQQLDATEGAALLNTLEQGHTQITLTLSSERASQTFTDERRGLLRRLTGMFQRPSLTHLLEAL